MAIMVNSLQNVKFETFDGPLDLLISLLTKNEIDILTSKNSLNIMQTYKKIKNSDGLLSTNELNTITGYDNCYIMADILISCSKLNLQEKTGYLLKKILKNLRIEKLKRSENEITIIATLYALINLLIRNKFFIVKEKNKFQNILIEIFQEVNYYINHDTENYELRVFLEYFYIFIIFYESQNYAEFCSNLLNYIFNYENAKKSNIINTNNEKESIFSIKTNFQIVTKIKALSYLLEDDIIIFETIEDKILLLSLLKKILFSPICYLRGDCRFIMEELFEKFFKQEIKINEENSEKSSKKLHFPQNYSKFLEKINKNYTNFCSKYYADDDWLYGFINEERASMDSDEEENMTQDDMSIDTHKYGSINGINSQQIKKYRQKYKEDEYALENLEVKLDRDFNDILKDIVDKLLNHPLSEPFSYELNEDTLGELYDQYMEMVPNPIDLDTIQKKVLRNGYDNFISFNNDINLMFRNCRTFNEKNSKLYIQGTNLEDYYKLIISPIKKNRLINKNYVPNPNNKISINFNDNSSAMNEQSEMKKITFSNDTNNNNEMMEINNESRNKFHIPFDMDDFNSVNDSAGGELLNKKENIKKGKNTGKKGKNNKNKKNKNNSDVNNINEGINLDENDEF